MNHNHNILNIQCIIFRISREVETVEEMDILARSEIRAYGELLDKLPAWAEIRMSTRSEADESREVAIVGYIAHTETGKKLGDIILNQYIHKYPELNNYTVCRTTYDYTLTE